MDSDGHRYSKNYDSHSQSDTHYQRPFARSDQNRWLGGVLGALAQKLGVSDLGVRILFLISLFFALSGYAYLAAWLAFPLETDPKSPYESRFLGVCSYIAHRLGADPGLVRFLFLMILPLSFGLMSVVYFGLAILLPQAPTHRKQTETR